MMLSLSATNMLLVSVIAFSYADLSNMITFTPGIVNNCTNDFRLNLASAVTVYPRSLFRRHIRHKLIRITIASFIAAHAHPRGIAHIQLHVLTAFVRLAAVLTQKTFPAFIITFLTDHRCRLFTTIAANIFVWIKSSFLIAFLVWSRTVITSSVVSPKSYS